MKENGQYKNRKLGWVAYVAGKRESRRLMGDYILKEDDLVKDVAHEDATFATTWTIDLHYPDPANTANFAGKEFKSIAKHIAIYPYDVPYRCLYSRNVDNLFMRTDHRVPDTFEDEMALVLTDGSSFSILSACSHRGITNIIRRVREAFPTQNFRLLQGGFHIHNAENEKFDAIANYFEHDCPQQIAVCHCTGVDKYALLQQHFGDKVVYEYTGKMIEIP